LTIRINKETLEQACKEIIETILFCFPYAYRGTVYRIGGPPGMIATRITSGEIDDEKKTITWGFPAKSDYNPPGKPWSEYRDEPGRPLEAVAWCVEGQRSWTAEDPRNDERSVRLQVAGMGDDYHHMEPVLIRKEDLYLGSKAGLEYPRNFEGEVLWQDSDYVVVAVIKIHFRPKRIKIGSPETRAIKMLSRALGTELLSYQLRQQSVEAMHQLAEDRLNSCNILAHSLRNAITKSGFIFSLIKMELGFLRVQWEEVLLEHSDKRVMKRDAVYALNEAVMEVAAIPEAERRELVDMQNKFLGLSLPPERGENWVRMQIEERWEELLHKNLLDEESAKEIYQYVDQLKKSLYLGRDPDILETYNSIPENLKREWVDLIYRNTDRIDFQLLDRLIHILQESSLGLPYQEKSRKSLIRLKGLAEIIGQLEEKTNAVLRQVLNGHEDVLTSYSLNNKIT
jgi:hypothetical protein